ncbi:MAG: hypothetical protein HC773_00850 [Scytonema sp. CRU_2_7]|nr:hypothetical protein [Scytonema sp. CRU_2_7]
MITEFQLFIEKYQGENDVFLATDCENQIWLRATGVCKQLGFSDAHRTVKTYLKEHQYQELRVGMGRPALYISESGFYKLILKSKSLIAEDFIDWLTEEVLPKLRASGGYIMPNATSSQLEALQQEITVLKEQHNKLKASYQNVNLCSDNWELLEAMSNRSPEFKNYYWDLEEVTTWWSKKTGVHITEKRTWIQSLELADNSQEQQALDQQVANLMKYIQLNREDYICNVLREFKKAFYKKVAL